MTAHTYSEEMIERLFEKLDELPWEGVHYSSWPHVKETFSVETRGFKLFKRSEGTFMASVSFSAREVSSAGYFETFYDDPHIGDTRIVKCAFLDLIQAEFESEEIAKACSELGAATKKSTRL